MPNKKKLIFRKLREKRCNCPLSEKFRTNDITAIFTSGAVFENHVAVDQITGGLELLHLADFFFSREISFWTLFFSTIHVMKQWSESAQYSTYTVRLQAPSNSWRKVVQVLNMADLGTCLRGGDVVGLHVAQARYKYELRAA